MTPDKQTSSTKICPTCGTRVSEKAAKCVVCGTDLGITSTTAKPKPVQGSKMPELTLSLPLALGLLALFVAIGAAAVFFTLRTTGRVIDPTPIPSPTNTPTLTLTPTVTSTATPQPTYTPLPPREYIVSAGDQCATIAATFGTSVENLILYNKLDAACSIAVGQKLLIPQPTPTPTAAPTGTLSVGDATEAACEKYVYTVLATDTLFGISLNFDVPMNAIKDANGLAGDYVYEGQILKIPTCKRNPTPGPSPTPTTPPPYPAPNLLLPPDGASFTLANDAFSLQWAAVGELRANEYYGVSVVDLTDPNQRRLTDYVTDTKFIVPTSFRPNDALPHVMKWWVVIVRQIGTDSEGKPVYESAGLPSDQRAFSWVGATISTTPQP